MKDNLTAFCMNKVSGGLVSVSTPKEILEVNMAILLHPSSWSDRSEDEAEYDILKMQQQDCQPTNQVQTFSHFTLVQHILLGILIDVFKILFVTKA